MKKKMWSLCLVLLLLLSGCAGSSDEPEIIHKANLLTASDETVQTPSSILAEPKGRIAEEAALFIGLFSKEYPGAYVTEVRWQLVDTDSHSSTYIIEGIEDGNRYVLKLLNQGTSAKTMEDIIILGRVERPLNENELSAGEPLEQPLNLSEYISVQQILDNSLSEYDSTVQEWKLVWVDNRAIIQVILWDESFLQKFVVMDAVTGEVLRKMP